MRDLNDGYTWDGSIRMPDDTEWVFRFRPLMQSEIRHRRQVTAVHRMDDAPRRRVEIAMWLASRIVGSSDESITDNIERLWLESTKQWWTFRRMLAGAFGPQPLGQAWEQWCGKNLASGVALLHKAPQFANRSCTDCRKYWFDDRTGKVPVDNGEKRLRPVGTVLLCETATGCPKGTPENSKALIQTNVLAYRNWRECKAVNQWPDDPIVRWNAAIISKTLEDVENGRRRNAR